jgi:cation transport ATPase
MAPATAADIGRNAADFVFLNESLSTVGNALGISRQSRRLIFQNFALAVGYNALAVPVAVLGHVTPLVAAVAMSLLAHRRRQRDEAVDRPQGRMRPRTRRRIGWGPCGG